MEGFLTPKYAVQLHSTNQSLVFLLVGVRWKKVKINDVWTWTQVKVNHVSRWCDFFSYLFFFWGGMFCLGGKN